MRSLQRVYHEELRPRKFRAPGCVYAVEYEDGLVKIGRAGSFEKRVVGLRYYRPDAQIVKVYVSGICNDSITAERWAQSGLVPVIKKEIYEVDFEEACARIDQATRTKPEIVITEEWMVRLRYTCLSVYKFGELEHRLKEIFGEIGTLYKTKELYENMLATEERK